MGGNGGFFNENVVFSSGITGYTAVIEAGNLNNGAGNLFFTINGVSDAVGMANFEINILGQTCVIQIPVLPIQPVNYHSCGVEAVHNNNLAYGSVMDHQGNVYKTIVIGTQEWMAENLKTSIYLNGDPITNVTDATQWSNRTTGAWCNYDNNSSLDCPYGKLYSWYTVESPREVCPVGWHVPTDGDWEILIDYLGGEIVGGGKMKSAGNSFWFNPNDGASNNSGFSGLPGGIRGSLGLFASAGFNGSWWSATEMNSTNAGVVSLDYSFGNVNLEFSNKNIGRSVRCVKD